MFHQIRFIYDDKPDVTLQTNKGMKQYSDLSITSHPKNIVLPPSDDARFSECVLAYDTFDQTIHQHLLCSDVIDIDKSPPTYENRQAYSITYTGFNLLIKITFSISPHLGGRGKSCE